MRGPAIHWTRERIIAAVRAEAERIGRAPGAEDLRAAKKLGLSVPAVRTVYDRFDTIPEMHRAAGLEPRRQNRWSKRTMCGKGLHRLTDYTVYTWEDERGTIHRRCRACHSQQKRADRDQARERRRARGYRPLRSPLCRKGLHDLTVEGGAYTWTDMYGKVHRRCRACETLRRARRRRPSIATPPQTTVTRRRHPSITEIQRYWGMAS